MNKNFEELHSIIIKYFLYQSDCTSQILCKICDIDNNIDVLKQEKNKLISFILSIPKYKNHPMMSHEIIKKLLNKEKINVEEEKNETNT